MATVEEITGIAGSDWRITLPDGMNLEQAGHVAGQPFVLNGTQTAAMALELHVHFGLDQIFNSGQGFHLGTLEATVEDLPGGASNTDIANGIRGAFRIVVHNDTTEPFGAGTTSDFIVQIFNTDGGNQERTVDTTGHPIYAHLHLDSNSVDLPGGVHVDASVGAAAGAYQLFSVDGPTVAPGGTVTFAANSLHNRDLAAGDPFSIVVQLGAGSWTPEQFDTLRALWEDSQTPSPGAVSSVDWDALTARVSAYVESTGQWGLLEDWLTPPPPDGGNTDYLMA